MVVLGGARLDTFLGTGNGETWTFFNAGVSSQKETGAASKTFANGLTKALIAVAVTSLCSDNNVFDSPSLYVGIVLGTKGSPFQINVRGVVLYCELFYFDAVCSLDAAQVFSV